MVGASERRKGLFRGKGGRSKKEDQSDVMPETIESQVVALRDRLQKEVGEGKQKDLEIEQLKNQLSLLTKEK